MDVLEAIRTRRSVRQFQAQPVPEQIVEQLLRAAMAAPSACNGQPWQFVVITDRKILQQAAAANPNAKMAATAPLAILVCGDTRLEKAPGYWPVDCAAAVQNLLLAAHGLGLGAVWTGIWPRQERMDGFRQLFRLPEAVVAHTMVVVGYPAEQPAPVDRYQPDRVHFNAFG